jgi:hypothetical protein
MDFGSKTLGSRNNIWTFLSILWEYGQYQINLSTPQIQSKQPDFVIFHGKFQTMQNGGIFFLCFLCLLNITIYQLVQRWPTQIGPVARYF